MRLKLERLAILRSPYHCALNKLLQSRSQSTQCISLTDNEIKTFQNDGVVCLRGKFSQEWLQKVRDGIRKVYENPGKYGEKLTQAGSNSNLVYFNDFLNWKKVKEISDFVLNSSAGLLAKQLMGSERVAFYHDHVFVKAPGTCYPTPWHQDQSYYPIDGFKNCSFWMPIDKVLKKDSVKYIKGSHRWGKWFIPKKFETNLNYIDNTDQADSQHEFCEMINIDESNYEALAWDLEPGDCIAFHMMTIHGAPQSTDENGRQVLASRWLGDDAVLAQRPWKTSPPVVPQGSKAGDSIFKFPDMFPVIKTQ